MLILKIDKDGIVQWERTFASEGLDNCRSIKQTPDGGYILVGEGS